MNLLTDLPAPAKLNLFLHVVGKRDDGYHLLQSVFVPIDWADRVHLERRDDGQLRRHDARPGGDLPADDLCVRAARALQQASGSKYGVDITLDKQLPAGAGMGGGSSDAATVLIGLNRLWGLNWSRDRLMELGLTLGADVPFFLGRGPAFVQGIGEILTPLELPELRLAVLKPAHSLPTKAIFSSPLLQHSNSQAIVMGSFGNNWKQGRNDLQRAAQAQCPQIDEALLRLNQRFGNSRMTGSGSAVFAEVGSDDRPTATRLEDFGIEVPEQWVGRICRSLQALPLSSWLED